MLKFTITSIILLTAIIFAVGVVKTVRAVDSVADGIKKEGELKNTPPLSKEEVEKNRAKKAFSEYLDTRKPGEDSHDWFARGGCTTCSKK